MKYYQCANCQTLIPLDRMMELPHEGTVTLRVWNSPVVEQEFCNIQCMMEKMNADKENVILIEREILKG